MPRNERRLWSQEEDEKLLKLRASNLSIRLIALELGRSEAAIKLRFSH
ncbi:MULTISPECIES: hypothetical protein [unclassified Bradyrhizobium]